MLTVTKNSYNPIKRVIAIIILVSFVGTTFFPPQMVYAQAIATPTATILNLPAPGTLLSPTANFHPTLVRGLTIDPQNPLHFEFIIERSEEALNTEIKEAEVSKLIKYFLASFTSCPLTC